MQLPPPVHGASIMNQHVIDTFVSNKYNYSLIPFKFVDQVDQIGVFNIKKIIRFFIILFKLLFQLVFKRPNLVYFTISPAGGAFYRDFIYVVMLKIFRIKIIYHLHGKGIVKNCDKFLKRILYRFVFKNAIVIHLSKLLENDIKHLPYSKIHFIPNGIEIVKTTAKDSKTDSIKLLFLSNLISSKGLLVLLKACRILKEKDLDFSLTIIGAEGDISFDKLRSEAILLGVYDNIKILGPKYGNDKHTFLNNSDILVFPTFFDCFPLVLIEGMQFGLPIVSTFEGAIPEIVDDGINGFLVNQKDVNSLAEKLETLIRDDDLRKSMREASRRKFMKYYTLDKFKESIKKVIHETLYLR